LSGCWLALAEQAEWLEARYGAAMSDKFFQSGSQRKKKE
jgi:hypothetical protein